jgi:hypothetical protein
MQVSKEIAEYLKSSGLVGTNGTFKSKNDIDTSNEVNGLIEIEFEDGEIGKFQEVMAGYYDGNLELNALMQNANNLVATL